MSRTDALRTMDYVAHIVEAIDRIARYVEDMTELSFLSDEKTQDAVVRNFEILGEAANNIDAQRGPGELACRAKAAENQYPAGISQPGPYAAP